jgi:hypothetical protein
VLLFLVVVADTAYDNVVVIDVAVVVDVVFKKASCQQLTASVLMRSPLFLEIKTRSIYFLSTIGSEDNVSSINKKKVSGHDNEARDTVSLSTTLTEVRGSSFEGCSVRELLVGESSRNRTIRAYKSGF